MAAPMDFDCQIGNSGTLSREEAYKEFLSDDFEPRGYANRVISSLAVSSHLSQLAEGIHLLNKQIHDQVAAHHEDLLAQATGVETLEGMLQMIQARTQSLLAAVERIRGRVMEPYHKIQNRTLQLQRLQETCDLLRRVIRVQYLSKRLHTQLAGGNRELSKAAQSLSELDHICEGVDLAGITAIEADRRFISQAREQVIEQARQMLHTGLETQNQTSLGTALSVHQSLGSLRQVLLKTVERCEVKLRENIQKSLDVQCIVQQQQQANAGSSGKGGPGKAAMPAPGNTALFRATLWTNIEKITDNIHQALLQVNLLQRVLEKKRDPVSHVTLMEQLSLESNLVETFWNTATKTLTEEFNHVSQRSTFLQQALEGEYPKLLKLFNELWRRLQQYLGSADHSPDSDDANTKENELRECLRGFERAYLSRSLSRLFDRINLMFPEGSVTAPTHEEVSGLAKTMTSELSVGAVDSGLACLVARNVSKTLKLFCVKCEAVVWEGSEATQLIARPTPGQARNVQLVTALSQVQGETAEMLGGLADFPPAGLQAMAAALNGVEELMSALLEPLTSSVREALEDILFTMHREDFSAGTPADRGGETRCSQYMRELQEFVSRAYDDFFSPMPPHVIVELRLKELCSRTLESFVLHVSLLRPVGEGGALRLAADISALQTTFAPLAGRLSDLGPSYMALRALSSFLFQRTEEVSRSAALGDTIAVSTVLLMLFGRAPPEFASPHAVCDWSVDRYVRWLHSHPAEHDRLSLIKGSLEAYVRLATKQGQKEFTPLYPVMLTMLQNALTQH